MEMFDFFVNISFSNLATLTLQRWIDTLVIGARRRPATTGVGGIVVVVVLEPVQPPAAAAVQPEDLLEAHAVAVGHRGETRSDSIRVALARYCYFARSTQISLLMLA